MPALVQTQGSQSGPKVTPYQACLKKDKLAALKPNTDTVTEFRPIPEVTAKGEILPMVLGRSGENFNYSAVASEVVTIGAGQAIKYTGLCRSSDGNETNETDMIFACMFIRLRGMQKKGTIPSAIAPKVEELLLQRPIPNNTRGMKFQYLPRAQSTVFLQGVSLMELGKKLEKPMARKAMVLTSSAALALDTLLQDCYTKKIDVFSPTDGHSILFKGLPPDKRVGRMLPTFTCELGPKIPLSPEKAKTLWTPWDDAFVFHTRADLLRKAIDCFGYDVVELVFPDEVAQFKVAAPPPAVVAPKPAPAPPKAATPALEVDDGPPQLTAGSEEDGEVPEAPEADIPVPPAPTDTLDGGSTAVSGDEAAAEYNRLLGSL
jgi:hypothetical protein